MHAAWVRDEAPSFISVTCAGALLQGACYKMRKPTAKKSDIVAPRGATERDVEPCQGDSRKNHGPRPNNTVSCMSIVIKLVVNMRFYIRTPRNRTPSRCRSDDRGQTYACKYGAWDAQLSGDGGKMPQLIIVWRIYEVQRTKGQAALHHALFIKISFENCYFS